MWTQRRTWIGAWLLAALALILATLNFEAAFPVVSLDLEVTRSQVVERARSRAERQGWGLEEARSTASFALQDRMAQTYVELEGGGRDVWDEVISEGEYRPYLWTVRLFEPGSAREVRVRFAPDGSVDGFSLQVPEDEPGADLTQGAARALAEDAAREAWNVRLDRYRLVETATQTLPGGRTDHDFVYERGEGSVGEARFRLRLGVSGDQVSEVRRIVQVPEAFTRRYREMRSSNDLIAFLATTASGVLYVLLGCGVGLFFLLRRDAVSWRGPLAAGFAVSGLLFAAQLNQLPLAWMNYDTALSEGGFLAQQLGAAGAILVGGGLLLALFFAVGEGLTRSAFRDHPRLWRAWSRGVANTPDLLGRTLGGYLFTALFIPYAVAFYFVSTRFLGWWTPAEALVQPDLVATPLPWLSAVATSLFAGTFEEALFRAVPLAGAALLGERTGRRASWIGAAVVLQAVIFAAAHANYPQQPPYARAVELLLPSLAFGVVYVRFGLVPAVIGHYTFDLAWMSLPLWASAAPGVWLDRTAVVLAGLAPLGLVGFAHLRWGQRSSISDVDLNRGVPPTAGADGAPPEERGAEDREASDTVHEEEGRKIDDPARPLPPLALVAIAALGLAVWSGAGDRPDDASSLQLTRSQAIALAADSLGARGVATGAPWKLSARPRTEREAVHRFVAEELGSARYRELLGRYLPGPGWEVRLARFEGTVEERAEEWRLVLDVRGRVSRLRHLLPEEAPGDSLPEATARETALEAVERRFGLPASRLEAVTAEAHQRPARRDWTFVFRDRDTSLERGQARVEIEVAGRKVVDARRFVHVPEEWRRSDRSRQSRHTIRTLAGGGVLAVAFGALMILALVRWSRSSFGVRAFVGVGLPLFLGFLLKAANGYPSALAEMSTSEPLIHQALMLGGGLLVAGLFLGAGIGLLAGLSHRWSRRGRSTWPGSLRVGLAGGAGLAGIGALAKLGETLHLPPLPDYEGAGHALAWLEPAVDGGIGVLVGGALLLALLTALDALGRNGGRVRVPAVAGATVLLGFALAASGAGPSMGAWLASGAGWSGVVAGAFLLVLRAGRAVVPGLVAVPILLGEVTALLTPGYPGARAGAVLASLVVLAVAALWTRALVNDRRPPGSTGRAGPLPRSGFRRSAPSARGRSGARGGPPRGRGSRR